MIAAMFQFCYRLFFAGKTFNRPAQSMNQPQQQDSIVLVDDDKTDRQYARSILSGHNYRIYEAINGRRMTEILETLPIDLILLDLRLPGENGLVLIERIRRQTNAPIIILSGIDNDCEKRVTLEKGADDYITKPFQPDDLCARIKASLRRYKELGIKERFNPAISIGAWELDRDNCRLVTRSGLTCPLTVQECRIIEFLARSDTRVLTRGHFGRCDSGRAIDVHITRLRKKFALYPDPPLIRTIRGIGYRLETPVILSNGDIS